MNLTDVTAEPNTDDKCLDYLEKMRWPKGVCCIACDSRQSLADRPRKRQKKLLNGERLTYRALSASTESES